MSDDYYHNPLFPPTRFNPPNVAPFPPKSFEEKVKQASHFPKMHPCTCSGGWCSSICGK